MNHNFPRARFVETNTLSAQLQHVLSEADEVRQAQEDPPASCSEIETEIADLTHSLETFWRILQERYGREYVQRIFDRVEQKNRARGYYDGDAA